MKPDEREILVSVAKKGKILWGASALDIERAGAPPEEVFDCDSPGEATSSIPKVGPQVRRESPDLPPIQE